MATMGSHGLCKHACVRTTVLLRVGDGLGRPAASEGHIASKGNCDGGDVAARARRLHQRRDRARRGVPQVDRIAEGDCEDVLGVPVEQVEVVVVEQLGRVEDALGRLRDVAICKRGAHNRLAIMAI